MNKKSVNVCLLLYVKKYLKVIIWKEASYYSDIAFTFVNGSYCLIFGATNFNFISLRSKTEIRKKKQFVNFNETTLDHYWTYLVQYFLNVTNHKAWFVIPNTIYVELLIDLGYFSVNNYLTQDKNIKKGTTLTKLQGFVNVINNNS